MSVIQIGLVDTTGQIDPKLVQATSIAINLQVTRDLPQFWPTSATVICLPSPDAVPAGIWPVQLVTTLPDGEGGYHTDQNNQPYAHVIASPNNSIWTIDASHEILEMLVDPWGNRMQSSVAIEITNGKIQDGTGQFNYLVEACDPCEDNQYAYTVNGIAVSDFITPRFYDPLVTSGTRYSFTGAIQAPRQILPGGYLSYVDLQQNNWEQILWLDPSKPPTIQNLPMPAADKSLREWIDGLAGAKQMGTISRKVQTPKEKALVKYSAKRLAAMDKISIARGRLY
jgi:hypothetical protein